MFQFRFNVPSQVLLLYLIEFHKCNILKQSLLLALSHEIYLIYHIHTHKCTHTHTLPLTLAPIPSHLLTHTHALTHTHTHTHIHVNKNVVFKPKNNIPNAPLGVRWGGGGGDIQITSSSIALNQGKVGRGEGAKLYEVSYSQTLLHRNGGTDSQMAGETE